MGKKHKKTPPALKKAAENKRYVSAVHGNKIYYTKEFYRAMYDAVHNGKGAVDAYASLGFDVRELGEDRAFAAARRAEQMSETGFAKMTDLMAREREAHMESYAGRGDRILQSKEPVP